MLDTTINFRASSQDVKLLEALEKAYGVGKSEILRSMIKREAEDHALDVIYARDAFDQGHLFAMGQMIEKDTVLTDPRKFKHYV